MALMERESAPIYDLNQNVFLIGFMGAGKSSVARKIARECHVASLDLDTFIERRCGMPISEIFEKHGEEKFREIETLTLQTFADSDEHIIISCGGGIVCRERNIEILKNTKNYTVHLKTDADTAARRISDISTRPLFNDLESARARCLSRMPAYEEAADVTIDTKGLGVYAVSQQVIYQLKGEGILCQRRG